MGGARTSARDGGTRPSRSSSTSTTDPARSLGGRPRAARRFSLPSRPGETYNDRQANPAERCNRPSVEEAAQETLIRTLVGRSASAWIEGQRPRRSPDAVISVLRIKNNGGANCRFDLAARTPRTRRPSAWFMLIGGAVLLISFLLGFADRSERALGQALIAAAPAVILASGLVLIYFFDHPYEGLSGSIQPVAMERALDRMTAIQHATGVPPAPCPAA
jgi:hypothetical protein